MGPLNSESKADSDIPLRNTEDNEFVLHRKSSTQALRSNDSSRRSTQSTPIADGPLSLESLSLAVRKPLLHIKSISLVRLACVFLTQRRNR